MKVPIKPFKCTIMSISKVTISLLKFPKENNPDQALQDNIWVLTEGIDLKEEEVEVDLLIEETREEEEVDLEEVEEVGTDLVEEIDMGEEIDSEEEEEEEIEEMTISRIEEE